MTEVTTSTNSPATSKKPRALDVTPSKKVKAQTRGLAKKTAPKVLAKKSAAPKGKKQEAGTRSYAKLWDPKTNKQLALKSDLKPHQASTDSQLSMKHFGMALLGLSQASESYIKHRVGTWGLSRLKLRRIVSPVKGKEGIYAIDRKVADEVYGAFLETAVKK